MNKKAYSKPVTTMVALRTEQTIMTVSDVQGNANVTYGGGYSGEARSSRSQLWGDKE